MDAAIEGHLAAGRHARAFDLIVPEFRNRVFRLAFSILKDRAAAEDAAQETFVRVWKALPGFDGRAALGTWIYAITRNTCLMELRKRRPTVSFDDPDSLEAQHAAASIATGPAGDPERDNLLRLLEQLPANQQQAVRLVLSRRPFLRRRGRGARHAARDGQEPAVPGPQAPDGACPARGGQGRMNQYSHDYALSLGPCAGYEFDLVERSEGALDPVRAPLVEQHLERCSRCRAYADALAQLDTALASVLPRPQLTAGFRRAARCANCGAAEAAQPQRGRRGCRAGTRATAAGTRARSRLAHPAQCGRARIHRRRSGVRPGFVRAGHAAVAGPRPCWPQRVDDVLDPAGLRVRGERRPVRGPAWRSGLPRGLRPVTRCGLRRWSCRHRPR